MACDPQTLVTDARCLVQGMSERQLLASLVCILAVQNSMACDPATLVADSKCLWTSMSERQLLASAVLMLCTGGGGGGGTNYLIIRDEPTFPVEPDPALTGQIWFLTFRDGSPGRVWDPTIGIWI